jgi:hypothetical protein
VLDFHFDCRRPLVYFTTGRFVEVQRNYPITLEDGHLLRLSLLSTPQHAPIGAAGGGQRSNNEWRQRDRTTAAAREKNKKNHDQLTVCLLAFFLSANESHGDGSARTYTIIIISSSSSSIARTAYTPAHVRRTLLY